MSSPFLAEGEGFEKTNFINHIISMVTFLSLVCDYCGRTFERELKNVTSSRRKGIFTNFCSSRCSNLAQRSLPLYFCLQCDCEIPHTRRVRKFCSKSCAATFNNTHKRHGTRRSKLEAWLEEQLVSTYPSLEFHFNRKDAIDAELDIYIPALKLAFELNGIYHYEPIHGQDKLDQIQSNDHRKFQACIERGIELAIIVNILAAKGVSSQPRAEGC